MVLRADAVTLFPRRRPAVIAVAAAPFRSWPARVASREWPARVASREWPAPCSPSEGEGEQGGGWVVVSRVATPVGDNVAHLNFGHLTANC